MDYATRLKAAYEEAKGRNPNGAAPLYEAVSDTLDELENGNTKTAVVMADNLMAALRRV